MPANSKIEAVKELTAKLKDAKAMVFVDYRGISVNEDTELRKNAREAGVEYFVAKQIDENSVERSWDRYKF